MNLAPDVQSALAGLNARRPGYASYQAWYDGEYDLRRLLDRLPIRNVFFKDALCDLSENLCPLVVDTLADRLQLQGLDVPGYEDRVADLLDFWRIDAFQGEVHRQTATQGDGYVLVWADPGQRPNAWFHSAQEMTVVRSSKNPALLDMALKQWDDPEAKLSRLTVYRPDRVERYAKPLSSVETANPVGKVVQAARLVVSTAIGNTGKAWEPYEADGPSVVRNPLGVVPVAVFNNSRYRAFGRSEIQDVTGAQRMLNKSLVDLMLASESSGVSNRYIIGLDYEIDPVTNQPKSNFDPRESIWAFAGGADKMSVGQFEASNLENLAKGSVDTLRRTIARVTRTPLHYLGLESGTWPSGESLKTAEAPFSQKVDRRKVEFGEPWEDAVRFALMFDGARGDLNLEAKWKDTRPRSEKDYWEAQQIQSGLGKSDREIWREEGWSDADYDRMQREKTEEARVAAQNAEDGLARAFASGGQVTE